MSITGSECNSSIYNESLLLRPTILLFQLTAGCFYFLATFLVSWEDTLQNVSASEIRTGCCIAIHSACNHH